MDTTKFLAPDILYIVYCTIQRQTKLYHGYEHKGVQRSVSLLYARNMTPKKVADAMKLLDVELVLFPKKHFPKNVITL